MFDLYIGNKNYSSWSLRPWLVMKHFGIPFREHMVSVAGRPFNPALKPIAGNARVPCLHEADGFQVWDSLAIIETLAEHQPSIWPADASPGRGPQHLSPKCIPALRPCAPPCR